MRLAAAAAVCLTASTVFAQSWSSHTPAEALAAVGIVLVGASTYGTFHLSTHHARHHKADAAACSRPSDCADTYACENQQCVRRAVSQRDEATRIFLQARAVALREELALGRGPVLAAVAGEAAGPVLKQHRAELVALIGDGSDPEWAGRFLRRAAELIPSSTGAQACATPS